MTKSRYRVLFIATHPVQYAAPLLRRMAADPRLEILMAYCSLQSAEPGLDPEFNVSVKWDIPLLNGYQWMLIPNHLGKPTLGKFWGLFNPGLWNLVRKGRHDAVVLWTGYRYASFWIALAAAKLAGKPVLFGTDASELRARDGRSWKSVVKRLLWPALFRLADIVILPSTRGFELMRSLGFPDNRLALAPYVVDNDWWSERAASVEPTAMRRAWEIPAAAAVVLFCAKLQSWKRPQDLLRAFAIARVDNAYLVFCGDGPLRSELEIEARALGVSARVRFIGFANQTQLPGIYRASNLMVLPSEHEPFGLVVNEAMLCGCPVVVSDRVGAGYDLVEAGKTGFVAPCKDVNALAAILKEALAAPGQLRALGEAARERMKRWAPDDYIEAMIEALDRATRGTVMQTHEAVELPNDL
jgi:glycosyltransferase involved in cell wall biosynthesis